MLVSGWTNITSKYGLIDLNVFMFILITCINGYQKTQLIQFAVFFFRLSMLFFHSIINSMEY